MYIKIINRKMFYPLLLILSAMLTAGCSDEHSQIKQLILGSFPNSTAVKFGKFTQFDDKNACYQISAKNYRGQEEKLFISLNKDSAADLEWSHWVTTRNLDECNRKK